MNQLLQDALQVPSLPYHLRGANLDNLSFAYKMEAALWFQKRGVESIAQAFIAEACTMQPKPSGPVFTSGLSLYVGNRTQERQRRERLANTYYTGAYF